MTKARGFFGVAVCVALGIAAFLWWPRGLPAQDRQAALRAVRTHPEASSVDAKMANAVRDDEDNDAVPLWLGRITDAEHRTPRHVELLNNLWRGAEATPRGGGGAGPPNSPREVSSAIFGDRGFPPSVRPVALSRALDSELNVLLRNVAERVITAATQAAVIDLARAEVEAELVYQDLQAASARSAELPPNHLFLLDDSALAAWTDLVNRLLREAVDHRELGYPLRDALISNLRMKAEALAGVAGSPERGAAEKKLRRVFDGVDPAVWAALVNTRESRSASLVVARVTELCGLSPNLRGIENVVMRRGPPTGLDRAVWCAARDYFINPTESTLAASRLTVFATAAVELPEGANIARGVEALAVASRFADRAVLHHLLRDIEALLGEQNTAVKGDYFGDLRYTEHLTTMKRLIGDELERRPRAADALSDSQLRLAEQLFGPRLNADGHPAEAPGLGTGVAFRTELLRRYPAEIWPIAAAEEAARTLSDDCKTAASRLLEVYRRASRLADDAVLGRRGVAAADLAKLADIRLRLGRMAWETRASASYWTAALGKEAVGKEDLDTLFLIASWGGGGVAGGGDAPPPPGGQPDRPFPTGPGVGGGGARAPPREPPLQVFASSGVPGSLDELGVALSSIERAAPLGKSFANLHEQKGRIVATPSEAATPGLLASKRRDEAATRQPARYSEWNGFRDQKGALYDIQTVLERRTLKALGGGVHFGVPLEVKAGPGVDFRQFGLAYSGTEGSLVLRRTDGRVEFVLAKIEPARAKALYMFAADDESPNLAVTIGWAGDTVDRSPESPVLLYRSFIDNPAGVSLVAADVLPWRLDDAKLPNGAENPVRSKFQAAKREDFERDQTRGAFVAFVRRIESGKKDAARAMASAESAAASAVRDAAARFVESVDWLSGRRERRSDLLFDLSLGPEAAKRQLDDRLNVWWKAVLVRCGAAGGTTESFLVAVRSAAEGLDIDSRLIAGLRRYADVRVKSLERSMEGAELSPRLVALEFVEADLIDGKTEGGAAAIWWALVQREFRDRRVPDADVAEQAADRLFARANPLTLASLLPDRAVLEVDPAGARLVSEVRYVYVTGVARVEGGGAGELGRIRRDPGPDGRESRELPALTRVVNEELGALLAVYPALAEVRRDSGVVSLLRWAVKGAREGSLAYVDMSELAGVPVHARDISPTPDALAR